jgi:hypothetical protein
MLNLRGMMLALLAATTLCAAPAFASPAISSPDGFKPLVWNGPLALTSMEFVGGRLQPGTSISLGYAGYIPLTFASQNLSIVFGGASGLNTATAGVSLKAYVGGGWGGDSKGEPSVQLGFCPSLLSIVRGRAQTPTAALCVGGALPLL